MTLNMYAVYDTKVERFNPPFYARNDQEACILLLRSGVPKSIYNDVKLFCFGSYDDEAKPEKFFSKTASPRELKLLPFPEVNYNG